MMRSSSQGHPYDAVPRPSEIDGESCRTALWDLQCEIVLLSQQGDVVFNRLSWSIWMNLFFFE